jgi:hypothetical protein
MLGTIFAVTPILFLCGDVDAKVGPVLPLSLHWLVVDRRSTSRCSRKLSTPIVEDLQPIADPMPVSVIGD